MIRIPSQPTLAGNLILTMGRLDRYLLSRSDRFLLNFKVYYRLRPPSNYKSDYLMHVYRFYFLDAQDNIETFEDIEVGSLPDAIARARLMLKQRPHHRVVEIWAGNKWIHRATQDRAA